MPSYNKVILMGHLTRDPELRVTTSGLSICKFGLAVNRVYTGSQGDRQEEVTFVDIDAFGRQADTIARYLTKGNPVLVEGRLKLDRWTTREGVQRSKLCVVCEQFKFVQTAQDQAPNSAPQPVLQPALNGSQPAPDQTGEAVEAHNAAQEAHDKEEVPF